MDQHVTNAREEARLVRKARRGNQEAFAQLYRQHARAIHALAFRLTGDRAASEDITQEVFLKMLQFLGGFRNDAPLRPWLKRVAANAAIDRLRRDRAHLHDEADEQLTDQHAGPALRAETTTLLQRLPPLARTLVWLHEMEGWSHQELGARFGRSQSWSKSIISRSLSRLRLDLERDIRHDND